MDIQVWRARATHPSGAGDFTAGPESSVEFEPAPSTGVAQVQSRSGPPRIRLEAGTGRWLLVVDDADRARHATLIEDIRAMLGAGECRFGTWSDSPEAGLAVDDWEAHGIRHALVFGGRAGPGFVQGGELDRLAASGDARRELWRRLQPLLAV